MWYKQSEIDNIEENEQFCAESEQFRYKPRANTVGEKW
jgi:hypothetical protein